jgi:hypothetical protein|tara:strand:+ start:54 stop:611 length:558 start_codon:yes stop_codon:yes gene_type:complete
MKNFKNILNEVYKDSTIQKMWEGTKYEKVKRLATTEIGTLGEKFLESTISYLKSKYFKIVIPESRRGDYDVGVINIKSSIETLFENKTATLDGNGGYQFNAFRKDKNFTHLFCLGIAPNEICYVIISKDILYNEKYMREHYNTVPTSLYNKKNTKKNEVVTGKLTINKKYMKPISELVNDLKGIL